MEDFQAVAQIASSVTVTGILLFAWIQERRERIDIQERYFNDLREVGGLRKPLQQRDSDV